MSEAVEKEFSVLNSDVKNLRADLARLSDTVTDLARKRGGEALEAGRQFASDVGQELQDRTRSVGQAIEDKPLTASMIAFGAGVLLGTILSGRRD